MPTASAPSGTGSAATSPPRSGTCRSSPRARLGLAEGRIGTSKADLILHAQELATTQILPQAAFPTYELAQTARDTIFQVIAAINNTVRVRVLRV